MSLGSNTMTFEEYLRTSMSIDHVLRVQERRDGSIAFYIHPQSVDGETLDFVVRGDALEPNPDVTRAQEERSAESS